MWTMTKPIPIRPVIAITYFLPRAVEYRSTRNGLRFLATWAVPLTGPRVTACAMQRTLTGPGRRP